MAAFVRAYSTNPSFCLQAAQMVPDAGLAQAQRLAQGADALRRLLLQVIEQAIPDTWGSGLRFSWCFLGVLLECFWCFPAMKERQGLSLPVDRGLC